MLKKFTFLLALAAMPLMASHPQQLAVVDNGFAGFDLTNEHEEGQDDLALVTEAAFEVSIAGTEMSISLNGFDDEAGKVLVKIDINVQVTNDTIKAVLSGESLPVASIEVGTTIGSFRRDVMGTSVEDVFTAVHEQFALLAENEGMGQAERVESDAMFAFKADIEDANLVLQALASSFNSSAAQ